MSPRRVEHVWLVALWLFVSGDPIWERIIGLVLRDDTSVAPASRTAG